MKLTADKFEYPQRSSPGINWTINQSHFEWEYRRPLPGNLELVFAILKGGNPRSSAFRSPYTWELNKVNGFVQLARWGSEGNPASLDVAEKKILSMTRGTRLLGERFKIPQEQVGPISEAITRAFQEVRAWLAKTQPNLDGTHPTFDNWDTFEEFDPSFGPRIPT